MNDPAKSKATSAREAASNLFQFLSDPIEDDLAVDEVELDRVMAAQGFDFNKAKKQLAAKMDAAQKQASLRAARVLLDKARESAASVGQAIQRTRQEIQDEIALVRDRLTNRGFAYAFRDFSEQSDEDLLAYLEDLKELERRADEDGN